MSDPKDRLIAQLKEDVSKMRQNPRDYHEPARELRELESHFLKLTEQRKSIDLDN
jgi:hypothetical protein